MYITFDNYCNSAPLDFNLQLNNLNIQRAENCKYLGVYIDYKINWGLHIEKIIKKTKYLIFIFHKLAELMQQKTLIIIYYALFHSVISYGIIAWGGAFPNQIIILERLQTKILKIINKDKFVTNNYPRNIHQRYGLESLLYHYDSLKSSFIMSNSKTRNKSLQLPKMDKKASNKSSYLKAICLFNSLPNDLKVLETVSLRKKS